MLVDDAAAAGGGGEAGPASRAPAVVLLLTVAAIRLGATLSGPVGLWYDSVQYRKVGGQPIVSLAFWSGDRPPLYPLLWHVLGSWRAVTVLQTLVAAAVWVWLAVTAKRTLGGRVGVLTGAALLGLSFTPPVLEWEPVALTESLSLSMIALVAALALRLTWQRTTRRWVALAAAAFVFAAARDEGIVVLGLLGAWWVVVAAVRIARRRWDRALRAGVAAALVVGGAVVLAENAVSSGRTADNLAHNLDARIFPDPGRTAWFGAHGMPQAARVEAAARLLAAGRSAEDVYAPPPRSAHTALVVGPVLTSATWAPLARWEDEHGSATYAAFLATHPWTVAAQPLRRPEQAFNSPPSLDFYVPAGHWWPPDPGWLWVSDDTLAVLVVLSLAVMAARRRWTTAATAAVGLGLGAVVLFTATWWGDGEEILRHTVEAATLVRVAAFVLAGVALSRRRSAQG